MKKKGNIMAATMVKSKFKRGRSMVTGKNRHIRRLKNPGNLRHAYLVTFMLSVRSVFFVVVENDLRATDSSSVKRTIRFGVRAPMIW